MSVCTWCHLWNQSSLQSLSASASACTKLPCSRCLGILGGLSLNRRRSSYSTYNGEVACRSNMPIVNFARPQSTNTYCFKFLIWKLVPVLFIGCPDIKTHLLWRGVILHPLQLNCLAFKPSQKQGPGGCSLRLTALAAQVHKKDQICARSMSIKQPNLRQKKNSVCTSKHRMAGPDSLFHQLS